MGQASGPRGPGGAHSRAAEAELATQWHSAVRQLTITAAHQLDPAAGYRHGGSAGGWNRGPWRSRRRSPKRSLRSLRLDSRGA